jgi:hypothetical protein
MCHDVTPLPIDAVLEGLSEGEPLPPCSMCRGALGNEVYFQDGWDGWICDRCMVPLSAWWRHEAKHFAGEHVRLIGVPLEHDRLHHHAPTSEEYGAGHREAYTENSVAAWNRHNATNYDELICNIDHDSPRGNIYYAAIRERVDKLIEDTIQAYGHDTFRIVE